ncbi:MAG: PAS domain S-box protein [Archaeoglobus sp.]|nr:PAS domain S-box protein [Archaeoglobus sp.]
MRKISDVREAEEAVSIESNNFGDSRESHGTHNSDFEIYRLIAENSSEGIFLATSFKLVYANSAFFRIIGEKDLKDKNLLDLLEKEDADRVVSDVRKALMGEVGEANYELRLKSRNGRERYISLSMSKVEYKGIPHALGIVKDITEKKKMEEQLRQYNELLRLTNTILRHDVVNNLNIISGCVELCDKKCMAESAVKRCVELIQEIGALESFTTSKKESLRKILERIAGAYPVKLQIEGDCEIESFVGIAFDNLIRNSVVHGGASEVGVKISRQTIIFTDNGSGIPKQIADRVFEKGFKFGETSHTGLGLYIVRKVVEMLGGSVELRGSNDFVIRVRE